MWIAESWVNGPTQLFLKFLQLRSVHTSVDRFQYFFSLTLKFYGDFKFDIVVYLKWLSEPQKFNFLVYRPIMIFFFFDLKFIRDSMICCKINFDIWYYVIFAANLYLSIFVWSSEIFNLFLWMLSFLFNNKTNTICSHLNLFLWLIY